MSTFTVKIQRAGTIPIPEPLCRTLDIKPGDLVQIRAIRGRIILTPHPERQLSSALKPRPLELIGKQSKRIGRE